MFNKTDERIFVKKIIMKILRETLINQLVEKTKTRLYSVTIEHKIALLFNRLISKLSAWGKE